MIRLYIENQEMDVTEGFSHQITYAVDDLQNLDSKATAFSKTIVLPGTSKNNYLLGNIFEFANANFTGTGENVGYNFNASMSAKCRLEINGLQIIKGVLRLLEIIRDGDSIEYEVAIFGELGGFYTSLSNKKLEDLDFSAYNHQYTVANITDRWDDKPDMIFIGTGFDTITPSQLIIRGFSDLTSIIFPSDIIRITRDNDTISHGTATVTSIKYNPTTNITTIDVTNSTYFNASNYVFKYYVENKGGCGVYYPLIDYGTYSTDKISYKFKTFRPALFVREYIHKIITGAGYTYESKFFETDFFKRLIIPHNESELLTITSDLFKGNTYYQNTFNQQNAQVLTSNNNYVNISEEYGGLFNTSDNITYTYTGQSANLNFYVSQNFTLQIYGNGEGTVTMYLKIYINGVPRISRTFIDNFDRGGILYPGFYLDLNYTLNTNDTIQLRFDLIINNNSYPFPANINATLNGTSNFFTIQSAYPITAPIVLNNTVELSRAIPKNVMQKDFFASLLKLFYLMVTEDKYKEKHLKIEPWTWFYNLNSDTYIDWSLKLDRSQPIRIKPMSEINSRYYELKYKSDNDYYNELYKKRYNEGYGDRKYDNQLEFAKDSQTTEVIFSATPLLGYVGKDKIVPTIMKWDGATIGQNEERVNSNIRIMQCKLIPEGVDSWSILNDTGGTLVSGYVRYPYAGHLDDPDAPGSDINFGVTKELFFTLASGALGNNLFNAYYSSYLAEITDKDSRLVTAKFKLNDTDIFNLEFSKFVFLDGVLYRLSKIVDYTPGEICTVELLRVIYTTYDNTVNGSDDPEVNINGQIWKLNNLDTSYYANGDEIPQITDNTEWANATEGAWCYYANSTNNGLEYGKLYNWFAVNDARGLAPEGYRVPTQADFNTLDTYISANYYKIKEAGTTHWNTNNGTNETGFTALGAGYRDDLGDFDYLKNRARFWTSNAYDEDLAFMQGLNDNTNVGQGDKIDKNYGFSVRLVKDI
jgi:uncharacterized protein (TIGR02145 family)